MPSPSLFFPNGKSERKKSQKRDTYLKLAHLREGNARRLFIFSSRSSIDSRQIQLLPPTTRVRPLTESPVHTSLAHNFTHKKHTGRSLARARKQMRTIIKHLVCVFLLLLIGAFLHCTTVVDGGEFTGDHSKLSGIIIPGYASTQLRAWSILDCPFSPLDFNPLDLVWLDTTKVTHHLFSLISLSPLRLSSVSSSM